MVNALDDPFPIPRQEWLSNAVQPFADYFSLTTLPLHIHEVLLAFFTYTFINIVVAPWISKIIFPVKYKKLSADRKINWDVHVVSLFQSALISVLALWVMFTDEERRNMTWDERVWGYTGRGGMIQGLAAGYFLWDLMITLQHLRLFGIDMLGHAISALVVFSFGFRPFVNYYASTFILYELSTIFLNFHWFFDKLEMTGSRGQLYNGIVLLITFFGCRLVWGTYQSLRVYQDLWAALHYNPATTATESVAENHEELMQFAPGRPIPIWLPLVYLASNILLNTLNFHWFGKMITTIRKRFETPKEVKKEKAEVLTSTGANGNVTIEVEKTEVRRRQPLAVEDEDDENEIPPAI
ncbi:TLC domain-containing protein [Xylogone sp. PMI_703]|nr:TLC domain-containing protein [Xylogone sp. PMI_703]